MKLASVSLAVFAAVPFVASLGIGMQKKPKLGFAEAMFAHAKAEDFTGDKACMECHPDTVETFEQSIHAPYMHKPGLSLSHAGCEGCHGPAKLHIDVDEPKVISFAKMDPKESSLACLRCHKETLSHPQWVRTAHAKANLSCVSCHQIHKSNLPGDKSRPGALSGAAGTMVRPEFAAQAKSRELLIADEPQLCGKCHRAELAEFRKASHHPMPEGQMLCSDCHSLHPTSSDVRRDEPVKDKCARCHQEVVGPFVYEHDPVSGWSGDGCMECHKSHGSQNPKLLKSFSRGLCAQCHTEKLAGHFPGRTCWQAGCHVAPHGSNTDRLLRSH